MPVESAADRAVFFNPDEFGVTARYVPASGEGVDLDGWFSEPSDRAFAGEGVGRAITVPTFMCRSADLPASAQDGEDTGDTIVISGRSFFPRVIEHDREGMARLTLEEQR